MSEQEPGRIQASLESHEMLSLSLSFFLFVGTAAKGKHRNGEQEEEEEEEGVVSTCCFPPSGVQFYPGPSQKAPS